MELQNMKSLSKTFDILEYIILQNGRSVTPSEIAAELKLNLVTSTRILGFLANRGYLEHVSRREGYAPGPMCISLTTRKNSYQRIADAAREPIRELSEKLRRQINLAVLNKNRRIMLTYHLTDIEVTPWNQFFFFDQWQTATGRLLLAAESGRNKKAFEQFAKIEYHNSELEEIRKDGYVKFLYEGLVVIGHLLQIPGYPPAAFGFGVLPENAKEAFNLSLATKEIIENNLKKQNRAF